MRSSRISYIMCAISHTINAIFNGWPDEMLSSRAYRLGFLKGKSRWKIIAKLIDIAFLPSEKNHCRKSYDWENQLRKTPMEHRNG